MLPVTRNRASRGIFFWAMMGCLWCRRRWRWLGGEFDLASARGWWTGRRGNSSKDTTDFEYYESLGTRVGHLVRGSIGGWRF